MNIYYIFQDYPPHVLKVSNSKKLYDELMRTSKQGVSTKYEDIFIEPELYVRKWLAQVCI